MSRRDVALAAFAVLFVFTAHTHPGLFDEMQRRAHWVSNGLVGGS